MRGRREARADARRRRLVESQLGADPAAADDARTTDPRGLRARARSLWCAFLSGLG
ncbi:MAG: hypothetical protein U0S36_06385 [Candidatus Nanopelagicales bacterium]